MKPSISMLAWYMREDKPVCSIKTDAPTISGVRFLTDETVTLSPDHVYVGAASAFFSDEKYAEGYIVVHGQDFLLFTGQEFDHLLNALLSALDYFEVWEERLSAAAESHAPLKTFIALGEEVMGDFFVICDMETNLLASSKVDPKDIEGTTWEYFFAHGRVSPTSMNNPITDDRGEQVTGVHAYPRLISRPSAAISAIITQFLFQDEEPIAYFTANQTARSNTQMQMQVIPVFCRYLIHAEEFTSRRPLTQSNARIFFQLLTEQLPEESLPAHFRRRMPPGAFRILYFDNSFREDLIHANVFLSFLRSQGLLCTRIDKGAAAIITDDGWRFAVERLLRTSGLSGMRCGVSTPTRDLSSAVLRYKQARFALDQAPEEPGMYCCEDYAFSYMLHLLRNDESSAFLLHPAVEKLSEYDRENQNGLLPTLNMYLNNDRNLQRTADKLNIHRSTLKYRLQRIEDIAGIDPDDFSAGTYLRLSLWIRFPPDGA